MRLEAQYCSIEIWNPVFVSDNQTSRPDQGEGVFTPTTKLRHHMGDLEMPRSQLPELRFAWSGLLLLPSSDLLRN